MGFYSFAFTLLLLFRYEVRHKNKEALKEIVTFVSSQFRGESGIIYCFSKKDCEQTAHKLRVRVGLWFLEMEYIEITSQHFVADSYVFL